MQWIQRNAVWTWVSVVVLGLALVAGAQAVERPNIVLILVDDMGYGDLGCYGSEIRTPHIDGLAEQGIRFTQMYNTAKCFPSRACLLTGVYAQQCGMDRSPGSRITHAVTLGEVLQSVGYRTYAAGKHHGSDNLHDRGFDHYYGLRDGACNAWNPGEQRPGEPAPANKGRTRVWCDDDQTLEPYTPEPGFYFTDAVTDRALQWLEEPHLEQQPFFLYLSYTAPHYPLHAWPEDIARYAGRYDDGYEAIREARYQRMVALGLVDPATTPLPPWPGGGLERLAGDERAKEVRRMEIYAAMLDRVDQNVGRVLDRLEAQGKRENTLILFASDNGACAEVPRVRNASSALADFGTITSYETVGRQWATVQNTPLRKHKNDSYEGGVCTPFIVSWPRTIDTDGAIYRQPAHFIDIMATLVDLTGADYPTRHRDQAVTPMQGTSLLPAFAGRPLARSEPLFWHWQRGGAIRVGDLKAVFEGKDWALYDLAKDRNEMDDLSARMPEHLAQLQSRWQTWRDTVGTTP